MVGSTIFPIAWTRQERETERVRVRMYVSEWERTKLVPDTMTDKATLAFAQTLSDETDQHCHPLVIRQEPELQPAKAWDHDGNAFAGIWGDDDEVDAWSARGRGLGRKSVWNTSSSLSQTMASQSVRLLIHSSIQLNGAQSITVPRSNCPSLITTWMINASDTANSKLCHANWTFHRKRKEEGKSDDGL